MARTIANIKRRLYKVMHRTPEAFSLPGDLSAWTTFLATFTELGICEDKQTKITLEPGEKIAMDDGKTKTLNKVGKIEGALLQSDPTDYAAVAAIDGVAQDILLVDHAGEVAIFLPALPVDFNQAVESGGVEKIPFIGENNNIAAVSEFLTRFAIPTS